MGVGVFAGVGGNKMPLRRLYVARRVIADLNLISFRRLYRSAIDRYFQSSNTGQFAIGAGGQFGVGGNTSASKTLP